MYRNKLFKFLFFVLTLENYYIYLSNSKNTSYNFVTSLLSDSILIRNTRIYISVPYLHVWRHCTSTKWRKIFCSLNQLLTLLTTVKPWCIISSCPVDILWIEWWLICNTLYKLLHVWFFFHLRSLYIDSRQFTSSSLSKSYKCKQWYKIITHAYIVTLFYLYS